MFRALKARIKRSGIYMAIWNYIHHVKKGFEIYAGIKKKYGNDCRVMLCPHSGTGDVYVIGLYLKEFVEREGIENYLFVYRGKAEKAVGSLFPVYRNGRGDLVLGWNDTVDLMSFATFSGPLRLGIDSIHHHPLNEQLTATCGLEGYRGLTMLDMYLYTNFHLTRDTKKAEPGFLRDRDAAARLFKEKDLIPGKTVLLAPYSTCIKPLPEEFWERIVAVLKKNGYTVCTNSSGEQEPAIAGTVPVFFTFKEAKAFLEHAGYFIGIRSGLCDIISSSRCKKFVLYPETVFYCPPGKTVEYVGLKNMGLCEDTEIVFDHDLTKLEMDLLKELEREKVIKNEETEDRDKIKLTVIISTYNGARTLDRTLTSVTKQGLGKKELEILVINNGSTDETEELLRDFSETWPLNVITLKKNIGVSGARNLGISRARGEYLTFCDSDDEVVENSYCEMYYLANRDKSDVVVGNYYDVWADGRVELQTVKRSETIFSEIFFGGVVWCKLYRTSFIRDNGIKFPETNHMEDNVFLGLVSIAAKSLSVCDKAVYRYMRGFPETNALSKDVTLESFIDSVNSVKKLYSLPLKCSPTERFWCVLGAIRYLKVLFDGMKDYEDRRKAFSLLQDVTRINVWTENERQFSELFYGIDVRTFLQIDYNIYETALCAHGMNGGGGGQRAWLDSKYREAVLEEFRNGTIGAWYILKYLKAWLAFKTKGAR